MPGDNVEMVCTLVHDVAAEAGSRFTLREGGKTSTFSSLLSSLSLALLTIRFILQSVPVS